MAVSKKNREIIFNKYGGRCAYCACELEKGWHVDHLKPIRRNFGGNTGMLRPQFDNIDNMMPSCPSCNINKHSMSLEEFRSLISGFIKHLNEVSTQYKIAKRYGLVKEIIEPIVFYFELLR